MGNRGQEKTWKIGWVEGRRWWRGREPREKGNYYLFEVDCDLIRDSMGKVNKCCTTFSGLFFNPGWLSSNATNTYGIRIMSGSPQWYL